MLHTIYYFRTTNISLTPSKTNLVENQHLQLETLCSLIPRQLLRILQYSPTVKRLHQLGLTRAATHSRFYAAYFLQKLVPQRPPCSRCNATVLCPEQQDSETARQRQAGRQIARQKDRQCETMYAVCAAPDIEI